VVLEHLRATQALARATRPYLTTTQDRLEDSAPEIGGVHRGGIGDVALYEQQRAVRVPSRLHTHAS